ncbi:MAG TPA: type II secretion system F family protein [Tepidisphaeraceae bacterium]|jgi:type II secretory pathway component PulF
MKEGEDTGGTPVPPDLVSREVPQLEYAARGRLNRPVGAPIDRPGWMIVMTGFLRFVGWRLLTAIALGLLIAALWFGVSPVVGVFVGVAAFVVLPAMSGMRMQVRRRRATVILSYLEQAARLNLPLARMLDAAQRSEPPKTARRLRRLRDLLEDGAPLEVALPVAVPEVSGRDVSVLSAAERLGRLPQALARVVGDRRDDADTAPMREPFARWYPLLMTLAFVFIVSLLMVFVMPKFEEIFRDFGLRFPPATRMLVGISRGAMGSEFAPIVIALVLWSALGGAFRGVFGGDGEGGAEPRRWAVIDHIVWWLPLVHGLQRDRGLGDACQTIADALRTGRSLPRAADEATRLRINAVLRGRLGRWREGMEAGERADDAARAAGLPGLFCGMIASGRGGDPAQTMEFLAAYYGGRFSRSRELLRGAAVPVMVLVFGAVVLFLAAGMYTPIISMIDTLSAKAMEVTR